jgi:RNA polymerase primary sigma factor
MIPFPTNSSSVERYMTEIGMLPSLSEEEKGPLFAQAQAGDLAARERLIVAHLGWASKIAFRYSGYGLPLADLISEANLGLIRAVELYDSAFGTEFTTYASVWIKQRIHRAITAQGKSVRVPVWRSQRLRKLDRLHAELNAELGRESSHEELGELLGLDEEALRKLDGDRIAVESIDGQEDFRPDEALLPGEKLSRAELMEEIGACLNDLTDAELSILSSKFGLTGDTEVSYREMAPRFGKSREWIRKVGEGALAKLQQSLQQVTHLPRNLVQARRKQALGRIQKIARETQKAAVAKLSVFQAALIPWIEPIAIL